MMKPEVVLLLVAAAFFLFFADRTWVMHETIWLVVARLAILGLSVATTTFVSRMVTGFSPRSWVAWAEWGVSTLGATLLGRWVFGSW